MSLLGKITSTSPELCKQFGVKRLGLFGSVARGDGSKSSDIDFFAEFEDPNPESMLERYFGFIEAAGQLYQRPIQLLTQRMIRNPFLKRSIHKDLVIVYTSDWPAIIGFRNILAHAYDHVEDSVV
jgi:predicted nucleotidyltransferase